ncbi:MAG: ATP-binding cassette domain-containing protein [Bacteroidetes bacterium]|nr:ATP-binding cassette domain-containing protein [Bacteroidota bacterium]
MLGISAQGLLQRYGSQLLFGGLGFSIAPGAACVLTGPNGSGKSTLIKLLAGFETPTRGHIAYTDEVGKPFPAEQLPLQLGWYGPYMGSYRQLGLGEWLRLHFRLRACILPTADAVLAALDLTEHAHKPLAALSSGMQQRAAVGAALFTAGRLLLLDEPTSNLDEARAAQMLALIQAYQGARTLVLASNLPREMGICTQQVSLG